MTGTKVLTDAVAGDEVTRDSVTCEQTAIVETEHASVRLMPRRAFEQLAIHAVLPPFLDGTEGLYRNRDTARAPQIAADNDWDAVRSFLRDKAVTGSAHTVRAYEKECLRLLLWCRFVAFKPLSSLNRDDARAYQSFLQSPYDAFVQPRLSGKDHVPVTLWLPDGSLNPHWRPFRSKRLSDGSIRTALAAIKSLSTYLVNTDYLTSSPFLLGRLAKRAPTAKRQSKERVLREQARAAVNAVIDGMADRTEAQRVRAMRLRYVFDVFYYLGLRMSEATGGAVKHFFVEDGRWWFRTLGKGQKERTVPVPSPLLRSLVDFRIVMGFETDYPLPTEDAPLVPSVDGQRAIKDTQVRRMLKGLFQQAADRLEAGVDLAPDPETMACVHALKQATPHWLRHTYATDLFNAGVDPRIVQDNLGHESMDTTLIYSHTEDIARHEQTERLSDE